MEKKVMDSIAITVFIVLLIGSLLLIIDISGVNYSNKLLDSENIPEDCKMPNYIQDVEEWKKNLRHNEETWHCLKYFE